MACVDFGGDKWSCAFWEGGGSEWCQMGSLGVECAEEKEIITRTVSDHCQQHTLVCTCMNSRGCGG